MECTVAFINHKFYYQFWVINFLMITNKANVKKVSVLKNTGNVDKVEIILE